MTLAEQKSLQDLNRILALLKESKAQNEAIRTAVSIAIDAITRLESA